MRIVVSDVALDNGAVLKCEEEVQPTNQRYRLNAEDADIHALYQWVIIS